MTIIGKKTLLACAFASAFLAGSASGAKPR